MRSSSNLQPLDVLVALVAILTAVLVVGFTGAPSGAATEPTISVSNALLLLSDEPLLVQGRLIAPGPGVLDLHSDLGPRA